MDTTNEADKMSMRPTAPEDGPFIFEVYASSRAEEMAEWGWDAAQQTLFLNMQFRTRDPAYRATYPELEDYIILLGERPAGRVMLTREGGPIRFVDLALLPEFRGRGIGTALFKEIFAEADAKGVPVLLEVLISNTRAASLYRRLGFSTTGDDGVYYKMKRLPRGA